ncbi:MAG: hypothetical protein ACR2KZ_21540, partial [Segetibacter sp.]
MRRIRFFIISFLVTSSSFSQVQYGIKGGLNLATVRYLNEGNSKARPGFTTGAFAEIPVQENLF